MTVKGYGSSTVPLGLAFAIYTGDLQTYAKSEVDRVVPAGGGSVSPEHLPSILTLRLRSSDQLVMTVQPWSDLDPGDGFSKGQMVDMPFAGVTMAVSGSGIRPGTYRAASEHLDVTFKVSLAQPPVSMTTTTTAPEITTTTQSTTTTTTIPGTTTTTAPSTTTTTQPAGPTFQDVSSSDCYSIAIEGLAAAGIISGYNLSGGGKEFRPSENVWRAHFAKMVVGALEVPVSEGLNSPFADMGPNDPNSLYPHDYVAAARARGIIQGFSPTVFGPFRDITRAQVLTMVVRALKSLKPGVLEVPPAIFAGSLGSFSPEHAENARLAEWNGLLAGLEGFGLSWSPWQEMTRGEVAQVLWNARGK